MTKPGKGTDKGNCFPPPSWEIRESLWLLEGVNSAAVSLAPEEKACGKAIMLQ